jgi:histidinol-phosphate/aromatic aminotransferase/cobyric acid decarboxylase-like protein
MSNSLPVNPALRDLPVYQPGRPIEEVARELGLDAKAVIKLASNENPLGPSPAALAAMEKALQSLHLYPDGNAFYLKQKLADSLSVEPRHLILGNGSNEIIEFVGHAFMSPGTEVIVSQYCFAVYPIVTNRDDALKFQGPRAVQLARLLEVFDFQTSDADTLVLRRDVLIGGLDQFASLRQFTRGADAGLC